MSKYKVIVLTAYFIQFALLPMCYIVAGLIIFYQLIMAGS